MENSIQGPDPPLPLQFGLYVYVLTFFNFFLYVKNFIFCVIFHFFYIQATSFKTYEHNDDLGNWQWAKMKNKP